MVDLNLILSVLLYTFGIILLIVLIILGIKVIHIMDKADRILDDMEGKIHSLDYFFSSIDKIGHGISTITENVVFSVTDALARIFSKRKKKKEDIYDE